MPEDEDVKEARKNEASFDRDEWKELQSKERRGVAKIKALRSVVWVN